MRFLNRERAIIDNWYPVRQAPRYGTHTYFDQHIVGWRPLPRIQQSRGGVGQSWVLESLQDISKPIQ